MSDVVLESCTFAFYYCDYADQNTLTTKGIIGSLVQQLLTDSELPREIADHIVTVFNEDEYSPTRRELYELFRMTLSLIPRVFLVIDGLDECEKNACHEVLSIINWILEITGCVVKIYISSQSDVQILHALATSSRISLSTSILSSDIESYVTSATQELIQERQLLIQDPALEREIITALKEKADGM